jgi:hypothetical protein
LNGGGRFGIQMLENGNRQKLTHLGGGKAVGPIAVEALVIVVSIQWIGVALPAQTLSILMRMSLLLKAEAAPPGDTEQAGKNVDMSRRSHSSRTIGRYH